MPDPNVASSSLSTPAGAPGEALFGPNPEGEPASYGSPGAADAARSELGDGEIVSRAEFNKVVAQRQAAKEKVRQLTAEAEQLAARLRGLPGEQELRAFQDWKRRGEGTAADAQADGRRGSGDSQARLDALIARKDALEKRLTDLLCDQELRIAAARAGAIHPEQVVAMLRERVRMVEADDGRYTPEFLAPDGGIQLDAGEPVAEAQRFVDLFLSLPESANLVRSNVTSGSGARQAGGPHSHLEPMPRTKAEFLALPPDQRRAVAARMSRPQRDALLGRDPAESGGYL